MANAGRGPAPRIPPRRDGPGRRALPRAIAAPQRGRGTATTERAPASPATRVHRAVAAFHPDAPVAAPAARGFRLRAEPGGAVQGVAGPSPGRRRHMPAPRVRRRATRPLIRARTCEAVAGPPRESQESRLAAAMADRVSTR